MQQFKYILVFLLSFSTYFATAQSETVKPDIIETKRGTILKGEIIEYKQGSFVRVRIKTGDIITIEDKRIKRIIEGGLLSNPEAASIQKILKPYNFREKGFYNFTSGSFALGSEAWSQDPSVGVGIHNVTGYQLNRFIGLGLGIGMDYYYLGSGENLMPVYLEARGYFLSKHVSPYYSFNMGYAFAFKSEQHRIEEAEGGLMIYPAIGFRFGASSNANFTLDFGYKMQKATYNFRNWDLITHEMTYKRLVVRMGVLF